jgi:hypothetical protein
LKANRAKEAVSILRCRPLPDLQQGYIFPLHFPPTAAQHRTLPALFQMETMVEATQITPLPLPRHKTKSKKVCFSAFSLLTLKYKVLLNERKRQL